MALVVDISSHGYGHLMQIAPVVRALQHLRPRLRVVARCDLPRQIVADALGPAVGQAPAPPDIGMVMTAPHLVDCDATWQAYRELFTDLDRVTRTEIAALEAIGAKAVLADISFMGIRTASFGAGGHEFWSEKPWVCDFDGNNDGTAIRGALLPALGRDGSALHRK